MHDVPLWVISAAVLVGVAIAFGLHCFGQGLYYMNQTQQAQDATNRHSDAYYRRHRIFSYVFALGIAPAVGIGMAVLIIAAWKVS